MWNGKADAVRATLQGGERNKLSGAPRPISQSLGDAARRVRFNAWFGYIVAQPFYLLGHTGVSTVMSMW